MSNYSVGARWVSVVVMPRLAFAPRRPRQRLSHHGIGMQLRLRSATIDKIDHRQNGAGRADLRGPLTAAKIGSRWLLAQQTETQLVPRQNVKAEHANAATRIKNMRHIGLNSSGSSWRGTQLEDFEDKPY